MRAVIYNSIVLLFSVFIAFEILGYVMRYLGIQYGGIDFFDVLIYLITIGSLSLLISLPGLAIVKYRINFLSSREFRIDTICKALVFLLTTSIYVGSIYAIYRSIEYITLGLAIIPIPVGIMSVPYFVLLKYLIAAIDKRRSRPREKSRADRREQMSALPKIKVAFSPNGRVSRYQFLFFIFMIFLLNTIFAFMVQNLSNNGLANLMLALFILSWTIVSSWISVVFCIKRYHDLGRPWHSVLKGFIPVVGLVWVLIETGLFEGQRGPNLYGASPIASDNDGAIVSLDRASKLRKMDGDERQREGRRDALARLVAEYWTCFQSVGREAVVCWDARIDMCTPAFDTLDLAQLLMRFLERDESSIFRAANYIKLKVGGDQCISSLIEPLNVLRRNGFSETECDRLIRGGALTINCEIIIIDRTPLFVAKYIVAVSLGSDSNISKG